MITKSHYLVLAVLSVLIANYNLEPLANILTTSTPIHFIIVGLGLDAVGVLYIGKAFFNHTLALQISSNITPYNTSFYHDDRCILDDSDRLQKMFKYEETNRLGKYGTVILCLGFLFQLVGNIDNKYYFDLYAICIIVVLILAIHYLRLSKTVLERSVKLKLIKHDYYVSRPIATSSWRYGLGKDNFCMSNNRKCTAWLLTNNLLLEYVFLCITLKYRYLKCVKELQKKIIDDIQRKKEEQNSNGIDQIIEQNKKRLNTYQLEIAEMAKNINNGKEQIHNQCLLPRYLQCRKKLMRIYLSKFFKN